MAEKQRRQENKGVRNRKNKGVSDGLEKSQQQIQKIQSLCGLAEEFGRDVGFFEAWVSVFDAVETC